MTPTERLTARLDDLASSLHRAGVTGDTAARLLELAAVATMKAVELEVRAAAQRNASPALAAESPQIAAPLRAAA
jgi:hypothetical protein